MIVYDGPLFRIRRQGRVIRGNVKITPEVRRSIDARLLGLNEDQLFLIPRDALRAVGARSTDDLKLEVRDGTIVLRPKTATPTEDETGAP